jgi:hypothetical protein
VTGEQSRRQEILALVKHNGGNRRVALRSTR